MSKRSFGIPVLTLGLVAQGACDDKAGDDDDDYSDIPLLGSGDAGMAPGTDPGPDVDPDAEDPLLGAWALTAINGRSPYSIYDYGGCSIYYGAQYDLYFDTVRPDEIRGSFTQGPNIWFADTPACETYSTYYSGYDYSYVEDAVAESIGARTYAIRTSGGTLQMECAMSADFNLLDCTDFGTSYTFTRE